MSRDFLKTLFATTALSMLAPNLALAASADADAPVAAPEAPAVPDIIVTARRNAESLQNVPVSEKVVRGDDLQKLSITNPAEISKLAPGLNISSDTGSSQAITLRGVTWQPGSGTPATPIYLNEIPFDPPSTIRALFDIGQIEVLRGPQGTTRGAPSISGAVTVSTKRPDLNTWGGYIQGSYGEANREDVQGAINIPLIKDMLAVRFAANIEHNEANRVYSVHSNIKPSYVSQTYRATVLFKPTDTLSFEAMYQHRAGTTRTYTQVAGTGSPGATGGFNLVTGVVTPTIPANFNGPALTVAQRASVQDGAYYNYDDMDLVTLNADWSVLGQDLNYNFGRQINKSHPNQNALDTANMLPGYEVYASPGFVGTPLFQTQEVRLSSQRHADRFFDYDIGFFQKKSRGNQFFNSPAILAGAFGNSGAYGGNNANPNTAYIVNSRTNIGIGQQYDSFYGNLQLHLPYDIELSGGARRIRDRVPVTLGVTTSAALNNVYNLRLPTAFCAFAGQGVFPSGPSAYYPGTCDISLPAGYGAPAPEDFNPVYHATIYNISLSRKFSRNVMAYFTTGSSYRSGLPALNNPGLPGSLALPKPETATSYELGLKTSWGRRLTINADVFQINYKNQLTTFQGVQYFNSVTQSAGLTSLAFYGNVDARVRGVELEVNSQPIDGASLNANLSYTPIKSRGGNVPCNVGPAVSAANPINTCASAVGEALNQTAPLQLTVNGGYTVPLRDELDGYLRFNVNFQGKNPNFGNFPDAAGNFKGTAAYAVVDLYAGVTGKKGVWDLSVYVKNVFNNQQELTRTALLNTIYAPYTGASAGYDQVVTVLPREVGVTLRYAFGSR